VSSVLFRSSSSPAEHEGVSGTSSISSPAAAGGDVKSTVIGGAAFDADRVRALPS
jgi:hypothetical protein